MPGGAWGVDLLEEDGVETPQGLVRVSKILLHKTTVNRYLQLWGYDHTRMTRVPAAVRFDARNSRPSPASTATLPP